MERHVARAQIAPLSDLSVGRARGGYHVPAMTTHTGTFAPTADGRGTIALDDAPDLPAGRRVRVSVEPQPDPAGPPPVPPPAVPTVDPPAGGDAAGRSGFERSFGVFREYAEELEAHVEEMRRLRGLTREDARRLRGE